MNERGFVERRKTDWDRLELILNKAKGGLFKLNRQELNDLGRLYRRVAGDLAFVRTHAVSDQLIGYLNDLVGRGHGLLYAHPRRGFKQSARDFVYGVPEVVQRRQWYIYTAIAITLLGAFFGVFVSFLSPALSDYFIPSDFKRFLESWKAGGHGEASAADSIAMSGQLWINNARVSILAFGFGMTFGLMTVYVLLQNGIILGIFGAEMAKINNSTFFWAGVTPHGVTELAAIFLSAAGGLILAKTLIAPGDKSRAQAIKDESGDAFMLLMSAVIMLIFAAGVEAWFSHKSLPYPIKFGFAFLSFVGWMAYWIGLKDPAKAGRSKGDGE